MKKYKCRRKCLNKEQGRCVLHYIVESESKCLDFLDAAPEGALFATECHVLKCNDTEVTVELLFKDVRGWVFTTKSIIPRKKIKR